MVINMNDNIREYAKIGLVHHLLYPECMVSAQYHADTLEQFVKRDDIESLDCCLPYGAEKREHLIPIVKSCGKDVAYALHLFPSRKISFSSLDLQEREMTKLVLKDQIEMAAAVGATGLVFASGADIPDSRTEAREVFREFCLWLCGELQPHGITALLEPFDRTFDKKYLFGPIEECTALLDEVLAHTDNIGIELDMAHLPLMYEEFEPSIKATAKYLKRIHLGNCVKQNPKNPLYGDKHPPIGIEDGEIDIPELTVILQALLDVGYLDKNDRKPLIMEMTPFPGKTPEFTVADSMKRLEAAWSNVKG